MLAQQNGKVAVAALGSLLLSSGFGWLPVARFVAPRTPPRPIPPKPVTPDPLPPTMTNVPSHGTVKVGPLTFEAMLSQSKLAAGTDGTVFVDVKLTADALRVRADERRPIDFALVLDVSGSMTEANRIGLLKEACLGLRQQLSDQDRVSVVSFSTAARTLHGLEKPSPEYDEAIRSLVARGGTNISEGLELGAEELRKAVRPGAARRVILLTDGDPTLGDKTPEGLRGICSRLAQQGISVSVVGLGLEYQSRLLSDMAEAGGGTYHFVDRPERIGGIYDAELRTLRTLVARGVTVTLEATNGAQLLDLIEWNGARDGNKITINAGDFESGRSTKIVARLKARTWRDGCENKRGAVPTDECVKVTVRGVNAMLSSEITASLNLGAEITSDARLAAASVIPAAQKDVEDAQVGDLLEKARSRAEQGDKAGARAFVEQVKAKRTTFSYEARDGKVETMSADEMLNAYESADTEKRTRALHFSRQAAASSAK